MGWSFRWASSYGSDYNFDLEISRPEEATVTTSTTTPGRPASKPPAVQDRALV